MKKQNDKILTTMKENNENIKSIKNQFILKTNIFPIFSEQKYQIGRKEVLFPLYLPT